MLNSKLSRSALSLILAMLLVFSVFTVGVFAEDDVLLIAPNPNADATATAETGETTADTEAATEAETTAETTAETAAETAAATEDAKDTEHDHEHETDETTGETDKTEEEKKGMSTFNIISLIILGLLAILGLFYCLTHREKVGKFLRSLRSELKKISWSTWKDVRKNTLVVVVVVLAIGLLIAGVDFLFSRGILAMKNLLS